MSFHEILNALLFHWKKIIKFTLSFAFVLFLILYFVYPITYSTSVSILPPAEKSSGLAGLLGSAESNPLSMLTGDGGNSQLYAEIIRSRSAMEYVIQKCDLIEYFELAEEDNPLQEAVRALSDKISVNVTKEGIIIFTASLKTGLFARFSDERGNVNDLSAKVSNTFVEALDKINREKMNTKAGKTRRYLETQLALTKTNLDSLETELKNFQEKNKTISLPQQIEAAIKNAAEVKSEIILTEIKINSLKQNMQSNNQQVVALENSLKVLNEKYSELEFGSGESKDYFPVFSDVPKISSELVKIKRNLEVQNQVYMLLQTQLFTERLQENKDIPTIQVLDDAIPAMKPSSPRPLFHTFIGTIFAFLLISTIILLTESKHKQRVDS